MRDANALAGRRIYRSKIFLFLMIAVFALNMSCVFTFAITMHQPEFDVIHSVLWPILLTGSLLLLLSWLLLITHIYWGLLVDDGKRMRVRDALFIVALSIPYYLSLPYIQNKINARIRAAHTAG